MSGIVGAGVLGAFFWFFIRQRRQGNAEAKQYNALVEQQREDTYKEQMELRAKGLGGFRDSRAISLRNGVGGSGGDEGFGSPISEKAAAGSGAAPLLPKSPGGGDLDDLNCFIESCTLRSLFRRDFDFPCNVLG